MKPPWSVLPHIPHGSIGWRMGEGEDVATHFYRAFSNLSAEARDDYERLNPEPTEWRGYYDTIRASPWPNDPSASYDPPAM